jgi:adenylate kinase family enzyme
VGDQIAVFGLPGTGRSTLAVRLAEFLDVPHHDLDDVLFTADGPLPLAEFRARTAAITEAPGWIVDGNYSKLADVTWHRAELLVWLDYRLPLIVWRVTCRNLRRLSGREVAPASAATWRRAFFSRRSVLANAVRKYLTNRSRYERQAAEAAGLGVQVLRLRTPRQTGRWLDDLATRQAQLPKTTSSRN